MPQRALHKQSDPLHTRPILPCMVVADIIREDPRPPLHTDDAVRAIGMPDLKPGRPEGDIAEHWLGVWNYILAMLHFFGAPAEFYETCMHRINDRAPALQYIRTLEAKIRRILLVMAGADARPLEPWMPRAARKPKAPEKRCAEREAFCGLPPKTLPINFVLSPAVSAPRTEKRVKKPRPFWQQPPACLTDPLPPELDDAQTRRRHRLLLADHWEEVKESRLWSVYGLAARFEALIRVYKDPLPYVMRLRQRIAAEQGRHAAAICDQMLKEPQGLNIGLREAVSGIFHDACAAVRLLRQGLPGRPPPIVGA